MDEEFVHLVERGMLHRGAVHNYLYLARTEMLTLATPLDSSLLRPLVEKVKVRALYLDHGDEWAPPEVAKRLEASGIPTTIISGDSVRHSFSCNSTDTSIVTSWVSEQVRTHEK